jgi:competence protein ComEC
VPGDGARVNPEHLRVRRAKLIPMVATNLSAERGRARILAPLAARFLAERERWALWFPVLMGIGIGIYFWLKQEPPIWVGASALAAGLAVLVVALRARLDLTVAGAVLALTLGFAAAQFQAWIVAAPVLEHRLGPVEVMGRLVAIEPLPEGARLIIAPRTIHDRRAGDLAPRDLPARLRVSLRRDVPNLAPGDWVRVLAMLYPPPPPSMPGAYDFERRAWFERLGAVGYVYGGAERVTPPAGEAEASTWRQSVEALRNGVARRIRAALPGRSGAIATAIIVGETHAIAADDVAAFRDAGLAHILVISGLHMGMVAGIAFFALRALLALIPRIALYYPTKKFAATGALFVIFFYLLLSGATVSSRRAFVMVGLVLLAILVDRVSISPRALAVAAVAVLLMTPDAAAGPSFQMSFSAVACLIAFYEAMRPRISAWHRDAGALRRALLYVLGLAFTTMVTTAATAPFTIYHFNRFPIYSVIANAVAVPITGFWVMPWGILACLLMPLGLERLALAPMGKGIEALQWIGHHVTSWPDAVVHLPSLPALGLAAVAFGGLWLCIWLGRWRWWGLAPVALGLASLLFVRPPDLLVSGDMRVVAVRLPDGSYAPSTRRGAAMVEESWIRRAAADLASSWPESGAVAGDALRCDARGCIYRARGQRVALIRDGAALEDDCGAADLVVSPVEAHRLCTAAQVIDRSDTDREGGQAVWLDPAGITIETVRQWQGDRPWSPHRSETARN